MTYDLKDWVINTNNKSKTNAVEMVVLKRCCGDTLVNKMRNEVIHKRIQVDKDTLTIIKKNKDRGIDMSENPMKING